MKDNQTISLLPDELFFSVGHLAAILSLLFIVVLVLIVIFLLFFQQRNTSGFDDYPVRSESEPTITESKTLELSNFKQYASTDNNQSMNFTQTEIDGEKIRSTTNLISSK
jgi:hypothetical protein